MPIPVVTCNADIALRYSSGTQNVALGASATESPTSWEWVMLSVPDGSVANIGVNGSFTNGVASVQNPNFDVDAGLGRGTFVLQARAQNAFGQSNPAVDKEGGQQIVTVLARHTLISDPNDFEYDWGNDRIMPAIRRIEDLSGIVGDVDKYPSNIEIHINTATGDDANDGLTVGTAKKTLDHVWAEVIPFHVTKPYIVRIVGTTTDGGPLGGYFADKWIHDAGKVVITGEDGYTSLASPVAILGNGSADGFTAVHTGAGWANDQHVGKWVRISGGTANQHVRVVIKNTSDTLYFGLAMPEQIVSATHSFEFVEPKTTHTGFLQFSVETAIASLGISVQHMKISGGFFNGVEFAGSGNFYIGSVMSDGLALLESRNTGATRLLILPRTAFGTTGMDRLGKDQAGCSFPGGLFLRGIELTMTSTYLGRTMRLDNCGFGIINRSTSPISKSRLSSPDANLYPCHFYGCRNFEFSGAASNKPSPIVNLEIDASGAGATFSGMFVHHCKNLVFGDGVVVKNAVKEGVKVYNSQVILDGSSSPLDGSNGTAGLSARHGSTVRVRTGGTPTITGAVDAATASASSTWASINGGTPLIDATEQTSIYTDSTTSDEA